MAPAPVQAQAQAQDGQYLSWGIADGVAPAKGPDEVLVVFGFHVRMHTPH